ncbi:MAG: beta-xylosidase [Fibrobacteria bacterium]|nr:beta-xylosidase [Fibrobacteria bacterium]
MNDISDFHTHHGAFGALGSFTLGRFGMPGGFNHHDGSRPGDDEVFLGMARGRSGLRVLPFFRYGNSDTSRFAQGNLLGDPIPVHRVAPETIRRRLGLGSDQWRWEDGSFKICTPFGKVPDPRQGWEALRDHVAPGILAILEFDNRGSDEEATGIFALAGTAPGAGPLHTDGLVGVARNGRTGWAAPASTGARPIAGFSPDLCLSPEGRPRSPHWLGACSGLAWVVPPRTLLRVPLALAWFHEGLATHGLESRYAYQEAFGNLAEVLTNLLDRAPELERRADELDAALEASGLEPERRWILSHAVRGYFGNSQLLRTSSQEPIWAVHEGEYAMINTLDLAVDQVFFEQELFPWVTREVLDLFAHRHSFVDHLRVPGDTHVHEGGVSFCHDMGVRNQFSVPGTSCYEVADLHGCFSHMTQEQAINWPLLACTHVLASGDRAWALERCGILESCLDGLERREHPDPARRAGVPGTESTRCGSGSEITTYDSLDPALAQARGNLYLVVKLWAAYRGLELVLRSLGRVESAERAGIARGRVEEAILAWPEFDGFLPAHADGRSRSAILPAVEGLVFPMHWKDPLLEGDDLPGFVLRLGSHLERVLDGGHCRFPDGGWRLSSTSGNSWLSKIALAQAVAEGVFGLPRDGKADGVHVGWLAPGSADWGFTDQIVDGKGIGSKYYPRGVSAILWPGARQSLT